MFMKKTFAILFFYLLFCNTSFSKTYYFKDCKISNAVKGDYIINLKKNVINVTLKALDGKEQSFSDKIKFIKQKKIISEKIKSEKGADIYYQYFLNTDKKTVIKLQYKKEAGNDMEVFRLTEKRVSPCSDVKADWNKDKIEKAEMKKEQKQISEAQEKIKKEQSSLMACEGNDPSKWTDCKGTFKSENGLKYSGLFKDGIILKGVSVYPGGAKYVGDFKNYEPHGYGNFVWANGDRYFGEWKNGKSHGNGTKVWKDGRQYSGTFQNDKLHGNGTLSYPDGKNYVGEFLNGKRHGQGRFTYADGSAYIGEFIAGKEQGSGECISKDGSTVSCFVKEETQEKNFVGKDTVNISIVAKKWVRISEYENNTKKGKKVMDKLKSDFEVKAEELCASKGNYNILEKNIEVLDIDETPAYGLETKLQLGINGVIECK